MPRDNNGFNEKLIALGITGDVFESEEIQDWNTPDDLGKMSIDAMARKEFGTERILDSYGYIDLGGIGVKNHAADLDAVGNVMAFTQRLVTAVGAASRGFTSARGKLSLSIIERTQLKLTASPQPASLLLVVTPKQSGFDDIHPGGQTTLLEEEDLRPLADEAMSDVIRILSQINTEDMEPFLATLENLGPRTASSLKELLKHLSKNEFDTKFKWSEPGSTIKTVRLSQSDADFAWKKISDRDLDSTEEIFEGKVITVSLNKRLELCTVIEAEEQTVAIKRGLLSDSDLAKLSPTNAIRIAVRSTPKISPGGEESFSYDAISFDFLEGNADA